MSTEIIAAKWNDHKNVTIAFNCHGLTPIIKVDRITFLNENRSKNQVDCLDGIRIYSKYIGKVDRIDDNSTSR